MPFVPHGWSCSCTTSAGLSSPSAVPTGGPRYVTAYGAHLCVGGKVVDRKVECPFHSWPGRRKVSIGGFEVQEHSGLIFVHTGPDAPAWEVPEATAREFTRPIDDVQTARIQEMRENIVDESHFHFIHGQREPPVQDLAVDGPFAEVRGRFGRRVPAWELDNASDVFGRLLSLTAALTTPIDDRTSEPRMLYHMRKPAGLPFRAPLLKLVFRTKALGEVREEVRIRDHKVPRPRPALPQHERGIKALRRWYAQFYPATPTGS